MDMRKYAGTAFIKLADLAKGPKCKVIESIAEGQYGRPVITFSDGRKLSLNVTNTNILLELFGQDSDDWIGKTDRVVRRPPQISRRRRDRRRQSTICRALRPKAIGRRRHGRQDPVFEEGLAAAGNPPLFFNMARKRTKVSEEIKRFWRLLDPNVSLERVWHEVNVRRDGAADLTIEALMFSLRRGPDALADTNTLRRLAELDERQLLAVMTRLQKFRPEIAPAWTPEQLEILLAVRKKL